MHAGASSMGQPWTLLASSMFFKSSFLTCLGMISLLRRLLCGRMTFLGLLVSYRLALTDSAGGCGSST